jgi:hypothetical protein
MSPDEGLLRSLEEASERADKLPNWAKEIAANLDDYYRQSSSLLKARSITETTRSKEEGPCAR